MGISKINRHITGDLAILTAETFLLSNCLDFAKACCVCHKASMNLTKTNTLLGAGGQGRHEAFLPCIKKKRDGTTAFCDQEGVSLEIKNLDLMFSI